MDRRVTPPKHVTSLTLGPPPPCKQALSLCWMKSYGECDHLNEIFWPVPGF